MGISEKGKRECLNLGYILQGMKASILATLPPTFLLLVLLFENWSNINLLIQQNNQGLCLSFTLHLESNNCFHGSLVGIVMGYGRSLAQTQLCPPSPTYSVNIMSQNAIVVEKMDFKVEKLHNKAV